MENRRKTGGDWFGSYPKMTEDDFTILYNHVLDQLRKHAFSSNLFRILRMRDARFTPPTGIWRRPLRLAMRL